MLISKFDNNESGINVELLEGMYDIVLPNEYKQFLIKYNGGKTPETKFKINGVSSDIQGFIQDFALYREVIGNLVLTQTDIVFIGKIMKPR